MARILLPLLVALIAGGRTLIEIARSITDTLLMALVAPPVAVLVVVAAQHRERRSLVLACTVLAAIAIAVAASLAIVGGRISLLPQPIRVVVAAPLIGALFVAGYASLAMVLPDASRSAVLLLSYLWLADAAVLAALIGLRQRTRPDGLRITVAALLLLNGLAAALVAWLAARPGVGVPHWWFWCYAAAFALAPMSALIAARGFALARDRMAALCAVGLAFALLGVDMASAGASGGAFLCEVYVYYAGASDGCTTPSVDGCGGLHPCSPDAGLGTYLRPEDDVSRARGLSADETDVVWSAPTPALPTTEPRLVPTLDALATLGVPDRHPPTPEPGPILSEHDAVALTLAELPEQCTPTSIVARLVEYYAVQRLWERGGRRPTPTRLPCCDSAGRSSDMVVWVVGVLAENLYDTDLSDLPANQMAPWTPQLMTGIYYVWDATDGSEIGAGSFDWARSFASVVAMRSEPLPVYTPTPRIWTWTPHPPAYPQPYPPSGTATP